MTRNHLFIGYVALLMCVCSVLFAWEDPYPNYRIYSRCWQPYEADSQALGLFHMGQSVDAFLGEGGLDGALEDDNAGGGAGAGQIAGKEDAEIPAGADGEKIADSAWQPAAAVALQPFSWQSEGGRFGGAIQLQGGQSVIITPDYDNFGSKGSFAVEAWVKPDELGGTLFYIPGKKHNFTLKLTDEGGLQARYGDVVLTTPDHTLTMEQWNHVAFVGAPNAAEFRYLYGLWQSGRRGMAPGKNGRFNFIPKEHPPELRILVNARVAARRADESLPSCARALTGKVFVGNSPARDDGFAGLLDELRISKQARKYYIDNISMMQSTAGPEFPVGQPIMRDAGEQLCHIPLNEDLNSDDGRTTLSAGGYPSDSSPAFAPGVHGQSVIIGPDHKTPVYEFSDDLSARSFTLSFWFSPHDWDNGKQRPRPEGNAQQRCRRYRPENTPHEVVPLVGVTGKRPSSEERWLFDVSAQGMWKSPSRHVEAEPPVVPLRPGTWYKMTMVVDHGRIMIYFNGRLQEGYLLDARTQAAPSDYVLERLVFGRKQPWKRKSAFIEDRHTLIDEIRLYSRPFTPVEVKNAYDRYRPDVETPSLPFAYVAVDMNPVFRRVATDVTLLSPNRDHVDNILVKLTDSKGSVHLDAEMPPASHGRTWMVTNDVFVPTDTYTVRGQFNGENGKTLNEMQMERKRPEFDPHKTAEQPPFNMDYYPSMGKVRIRFKPIWEMSTIRSDFLSTPDGDFGLMGQYYGNTECEGRPLTTRVDPQVGFKWKNTPAHNIAPDYFGVVWTGQLGPVPYGGTYNVRVKTGGSAKLWIDGDKIIDTTENGSDDKASNRAQVTFSRGSTHDIRLQYGAGSGTSQCHLQWQLADPVPLDHRDPALVRIIDSEDDTILDKQVQIARWNDQLLDIGDVPAGTYRVEVKAPGGRRFYPRWFEREYFVWEDNRLGVTDKVYPPFKPIKVDGDQVSVVMRRLQKDGLGFWQSVEARGNETPYKELLARPIQLVANGQPVSGEGQFAREDDHEIIYRGNAQTPAVNVNTKMTTEYDGCMRVEMTLEPGSDSDNTPLKDMHLDIPLKDSMAPLWHVVKTGIRNNPAGHAPGGTGKIWDSRKFRDGSLPGNFLPYIWLGAEERGLSWFADNERGWVLGNPKKDPCLSLHRRNGTLTLRIHLVQKPINLKDKRRIVFGLMASPGKPMPDNWRNILFNKKRKGFRDIGWSGSTYWGASETMHETYPYGYAFEVLDKFQEVRLTGRASGMKTFMQAYDRNHMDDYEPRGRKSADQIRSLINHMVGQSKKQPYYRNVYWDEFFSASWWNPETQQFMDEWYGDKRFGFRPSDSYINFQCWYGAGFLRRGIGLYFDNTFPKAASNPFLSTAYRDEDGKIHNSARMWWHREYLKRIWILHQQLAPAATKPIMMFHMTNSHMVPYMTHGQTNLDLEWKYGPAPAQRKFRPDLLRAETLGLQSGNVPLALADIDPLSGRPVPDAKAERARRTYFGVLMVHEIRYRYGGISSKLMNFLFDFGYGQEDCEVHNYWASDPVVEVNDDRCKWLLLKNNGELMLLLTTWNKKPGEVDLNIAWDRLGISPTDAIDMEYPEKDAVTDQMDDLMALDGENGDDEDVLSGEPDGELVHTGSEWQGPVKLDEDTGQLTVSMGGYGVRIIRIE